MAKMRLKCSSLNENYFESLANGPINQHILATFFGQRSCLPSHYVMNVFLSASKNRKTDAFEKYPSLVFIRHEL